MRHNPAGDAVLQHRGPMTVRSAAEGAAAVGLPEAITTCLFDLDGVLTKTAVVHGAAWKEMFDDFLKQWSAEHSTPQEPFDPRGDYDRYVDGKPRYDGVRSFLKSRGIQLPDGSPSDQAGEQTVCGLGNRKNDMVQLLIERDGVEAYPGSIEYLDACRTAGMRLAVVSSSANCRAILRSCGLIHLFEEIMDGEVAAREGIKGKPAPDTFLAAAAALGAEPDDAAVFEDALAGVEAGRAGNFGFVVGVNRVGQADALKERGADVVVDDLKELIKQT